MHLVKNRRWVPRQDSAFLIKRGNTIASFIIDGSDPVNRQTFNMKRN